MRRNLTLLKASGARVIHSTTTMLVSLVYYPEEEISRKGQTPCLKGSQERKPLPEIYTPVLKTPWPEY